MILTGHVELVQDLGEVLLLLLLCGDDRLGPRLLLLQHLLGAVVEGEQSQRDRLLVSSLILLRLLGKTQLAEDLAPDGFDPLLLHHLQVYSLTCGHAAHTAHHVHHRKHQQRELHGACRSDCHH